MAPRNCEHTVREEDCDLFMQFYYDERMRLLLTQPVESITNDDFLYTLRFHCYVRLQNEQFHELCQRHQMKTDIGLWMNEFKRRLLNHCFQLEPETELHPLIIYEIGGLLGDGYYMMKTDDPQTELFYEELQQHSAQHGFQFR